MVAHSPRVLIADDESQLLRVLARVLEKPGYTVVPTQDSKAAIVALRGSVEPIDVIVIDAAINPEGAGAVLDVLATEQPQIGVIVTSGDQLSTRLRSQLNACGGIFLLKPFLPGALVEAVENALAGRSGE